LKKSEACCLKKASVGKAILMAFAAALVIQFFMFDFMIAEGCSMQPAVQPGTVLIVCRVFYGLKLPGAGNNVVSWQTPRPGDVVVFRTPAGDIAVKRFAKNLPDGTFMALGDNTPYSYDSRNYGPVPKDNIIGRVLGVR